jgi:hypothetical protein
MTKQKQEKVNEILKEIYLIDLSLKKEEQKIRLLVEKMIEIQPEAKINEQFVASLKERVFTEIDNIKTIKESKFLFWHKFTYVSTGAVIIILLSLIVLPKFFNNDFKSQEDKSIALLNERAFGDLNIDLSLKASSDGAERMAERAESSVVGLGSVSVLDSMPSQIEDISIMPYPIEQKNYYYVYEGNLLEEINLAEISNLVYKRETENNTARQAADSLSKTPNLPINLNNFSQKEVKHININEEKAYGYSISLNLANNTLSLYSNWEKWPQPYKDCYDNECIKSLNLGASDMITENQLISIADNFINNYQIDLSDYGPAYISEETIKAITNPENIFEHTYPEEVSIIYPLIINNMEVVDNYGSKEGIQIAINIREKRVSSLYNINFSRLLSSAYDLIDNLENIEPLLKKGGLSSNIYRRNDLEEVEIKLGKPKIALVRTWIPSPSSGNSRTSSEIFLPSLVFPIKEKPNEYFHRQQVVIPLIREVFKTNLERLENQGQEDYDIIPMPSVRPDTPIIDI